MISIIIPTYNRENLITRSAESVLAQTYEDLELIIVDDGSTDNTQSIVKSIADSRVNYVKLPQGKGAPAARNYGVSIAKGEYVAFQDSDDIWIREKLDTQLEFLQRFDADVVACAYTDLTGSKLSYWDAFSGPGQVLFLDLFPGNIISTQTILGKKECFLNCPFDVDFPRLQDWELATRLVQTYRVFLDTEPLVKVCLQGDRISSDYGKFYKSINMLFKKILNMPPGDEQREALSRLFDSAHRGLINNEERLQNYESRCEQYESRCEQYESRCKQYESRCHCYESSKSWKITQPLRDFVNLIKKHTRSKR